jgi:hypothetical protein
MDSVRLVKGDIFQGAPSASEGARVVGLGRESIDNSAGGLTIHANPFPPAPPPSPLPTVPSAIDSLCITLIRVPASRIRSHRIWFPFSFLRFGRSLSGYRNWMKLIFRFVEIVAMCREL